MIEPDVSYVYFAFKGDDFDPQKITDKLNITPTTVKVKGEKGRYNSKLDFSSWQFCAKGDSNNLNIDNLVNKLITRFDSSIE